MRAFRFVGAYKRAAAHSRARGKTASMPALVCVYLIASDAHASRALTPFLSQVFLTRCRHTPHAGPAPAGPHATMRSEFNFLTKECTE